MEWKKFLLFNLLGAACWVTKMSMIGYAFANEFQSLLGFLEKLSWVIDLVVFAVGYLLWRHEKKSSEKGRADLPARNP